MNKKLILLALLGYFASVSAHAQCEYGKSDTYLEEGESILRVRTSTGCFFDKCVKGKIVNVGKQACDVDSLKDAAAEVPQNANSCTKSGGHFSSGCNAGCSLCCDHPPGDPERPAFCGDEE